MTSFYKHYKNKPYKLLGTARHSETLEELALYEARYPNQLGSIWVRPKEMFFDQVEIKGQKQPRFRKVEFDFSETQVVTSELKKSILDLLTLVFETYSEEKFDQTLKNGKEFFLIATSLDNQLVGFKLGYAKNEERFYSWLGAVHPDYQRYGVGQELMSRQHQWCKKKNFKIIETKTLNKWKAMLILNIKNDFQIVGTDTNQKGETKIIMEKYLR